MGLTGDAKRDYPRSYMKRKRSNISGSNGVGSNILQRSKGKTPEESGYPPGQAEVRIGEQGQKLWRLRGRYSLPNSVLCNKA